MNEHSTISLVALINTEMEKKIFAVIFKLIIKQRYMYFGGYTFSDKSRIFPLNFLKYVLLLIDILYVSINI